MRVLMVPVANRPECIAALRATFELAHRLGACVQASHVRPHRFSVVALPAEAGYVIPDGAIEEAADKAEAAEIKAAGEAEAMVDEIGARAGFKRVRRIRGNTADAIVWTELVGDPGHLMRVQGVFADLLVVSRPSTRKSFRANEFLQAALLDSSRPVLIVPPRGARAVGRRVVIAWDRSHYALAAVVAALPILQQADTVIVVTSGIGKGDGPKAQSLIGYLNAWGIEAQHVAKRDARVRAQQDIENCCDDVDADLLVMGSYSRSRLRERIFGGVTDHMLANTKRPILTIHSG